MDSKTSLYISVLLYSLINLYIIIRILKSKNPIVVSALLQHIAISVCSIPFIHLLMTVTIPEKLPFLMEYRWLICVVLISFLIFGLIKNMGTFSIIGLDPDIFKELDVFKTKSINPDQLNIDNKIINISYNDYFYIIHFSSSINGIKESVFFKDELKNQIQTGNHLINKKSMIFYMISIVFSFIIYMFILSK